MTTRNIIILPPAEVAKRAMFWSRSIASTYTADFVLDGKQFYPHITLYQAAYPDKNIPKVGKMLTSLVKNIKPFQVHASAFSSLVGFIFLNFVKSQEFVSLHKQIVAACNPLREGESIPSERNNLTDPAVPEFIKYSIRTYGSALAMEAYMPHITITRLRNFSEIDSARKKLKYVDISFGVNSVYLANIGLDGTVNEIFKEIPFR